MVEGVPGLVGGIVGAVYGIIIHQSVRICFHGVGDYGGGVSLVIGWIGAERKVQVAVPFIGVWFCQLEQVVGNIVQLVGSAVGHHVHHRHLLPVFKKHPVCVGIGSVRILHGQGSCRLGRHRPPD